MTGGSTAGPQSYKKQLPQIPTSSIGLQHHRMPISSNIYSSPENYYSNPPPPLPYRPPPPNPYLSMPNNQNYNLNQQSPNGASKAGGLFTQNSQPIQTASDTRSPTNAYQ